VKASKVCDKRRRNILKDALGLESTFAPLLVRETIIKDRKTGGLKSISSGRDGRPLYIGNTNKSLRYLKEGMGKFSSPWRNGTECARKKSKRFSYLCAVIAQCGLREKAIKPLVRLSAQFWKLRLKDFWSLTKLIIALSSDGDMVRRTTARIRLQSKPSLTGSVKNLGSNLGSVPLWEWKMV
jgi:hypothetical protein